MVHTQVTSVTQTLLTLGAVKSRRSRFGAIGLVCFESVVALNQRLRFAAIPALRMTRATRFSLVRIPFARRSRKIRGLP